jgi:adenylate cyclase
MDILTACLRGGERAIALNANDADSYASLGNTLVFAGRPAEGIKLIQKAMRLNPHYPPRYLNLLGLAYHTAERCEEALVPLEKAVTLEPNFFPSHANLSACYAELDRLAEAQREMAEILRINPNASLERQRKFMPYKDPADMERNLAALRENRSRTDYHAWLWQRADLYGEDADVIV